MNSDICQEPIRGKTAETPVSNRVFLSSLLVSGKQLICQAIFTLTGIFLARELSQEGYGIYAIAGYLYFVFQGLSDLGIGASLIRQAEHPSDQSYRLCFSIRQVIDLVVFTAVWISAPNLAIAYQLTPEYIWMFRILAAAALINGFSVVPTIMLERKINFRSLAVVEFFQVVFLCSTAILLVLYKTELPTLALAWLIYSLTAAVLSNFFQPWRPRWGGSMLELKSRLPYSLPFQGIGLLAHTRDGVTPLLVGITLGSKEVGSLNWATMLAGFSIIPALALQRLYLTGFARVQSDPEKIKTLLSEALFMAQCLTAPLAVTVLIFAEPIATVVFGAKWLPSLKFFYPLWIANIGIPIATPIVGYLNATGKSKTALSFSAFWTSVLWLASFLLLPVFGSMGFPSASILAQLCVAWLWITFVSSLSVSFLKTVALPWILASAIGMLTFMLLGPAKIETLFQLLLSGVLAVSLQLVGVATLIKFTNCPVPNFRKLKHS